MFKLGLLLAILNEMAREAMHCNQELDIISRLPFCLFFLVGGGAVMISTSDGGDVDISVMAVGVLIFVTKW